MGRKTIILGVLSVLIFAGAAMACPMCKDALSNGDPTGSGKLPNGFNTSIIVMLVGFLSVVGMVCGIIWKGISGSM